MIYSAHWDHLGIGTPVNGDAIYNGAIDNATGCAILMELARVWGSLPQKPNAVGAVPGGHGRGGRAAGAPNTTPRIRWSRSAKTAIALNYDALYPWGRAKDVVITGAERTTV